MSRQSAATMTDDGPGRAEAGPPPELDLVLLGGFRLTAGGQPVSLRYSKSKAVVARVHNVAVPVPRPALASLLWPRLPTDRAKANLRVVLADLRSSLGDLVAVDAHSVAIAPGAQVRSDYARWLAFRDHGHPDLLDEEAVAFLATESGPFLHGLEVTEAPDFETWVRETDSQIREAKVDVLTSIVNSRIDQMEVATTTPRELMRLLQALRSADPTNERSLRLVMTTMDRIGRGEKALDAYRGFRTHQASTGDPCEPETLHLAQSIARRLYPDHDRRTPLPSRPPHLPLPAAVFGREAEVTAVLDGFAQGRRLVTVTGMGGVGKTAVAHAVGERGCGPGDPWPYSVTDLSGARPEDDLAVVVATSLGLALAGLRPPDEELALTLRPHRHLLILDTGEHLIAPLGRLVASLLGRCPVLRVLLTSRSPLHLETEHLVHLNPLPVPAPDATPEDLAANSGVRLVIDRARATGATADSADDLAAIGELCRQFDGIPLALELVATRMRLLSADELVAAFASGNAELEDESGRRPDRHRTLGRSVAWSYEHLDDRQRRVLRALSVFRGGAMVAAVDGLLRGGPPARSAIVALLDASLVQRIRTPVGSRLILPVPARDFAHAALVAAGEADRWERRHASLFLTYAEQASVGLQGRAQNEWLARLDLDHENLVAALGTFHAAGDAGGLLRMTLALGWFWHIRGHTVEGRGWLDRASELGLAVAAGADPELLALVGRAETRSAFLSIRAHDKQSASDRLVLARRAFGRCHDPAGAGELAHVEVLYHLYSEAEPFDPALVGHIAKSIRTAEALGATWDAARRRYTEAWVHIRAGAFREAEQSGIRCRDTFRELGDPRGIAIGTLAVAVSRGLQGDWSLATTELPEAYRTLRETGDLTHGLYALCCAAGGFAMTARPVEAARLYGAAAALRTQTGIEVPAAFQALDAGMREIARSDLSDASWRTEWERGEREAWNVVP